MKVRLPNFAYKVYSKCLAVYEQQVFSQERTHKA